MPPKQNRSVNKTESLGRKEGRRDRDPWSRGVGAPMNPQMGDEGEDPPDGLL